MDRGILICGTGQGMAIAANKCKGIRCALCYDVFPAIMSREHNNSNMLATGAWMVSLEKAMNIIEAWLFGTTQESTRLPRLRTSVNPGADRAGKNTGGKHEHQRLKRRSL